MLNLDQHPEHANALITAALKAADPVTALQRHWNITDLHGDIHLLAIGKAARPMALEAFRHLGPRITRALITAPPDQSDPRGLRPNTQLFPCDHPYPTQRNIEAAQAVRDFITSASENDTLLCLISGGGSAHLCLPAGDLTLHDIIEVTRELQLAGATIDELNCVRKHCELLKGGNLARLSRAGRLVAYILSDVIGDKLDIISSGPTAPDPTTYRDAQHVLASHAITLPNISAHLTSGILGDHPETPKPRDPAFARVTNRIIASNRQVTDAVAAAAQHLGFHIDEVEQQKQGEAADVAAGLANTAKRLQAVSRPTACILGGEWTVTVSSGGAGAAAGTGGPSQELALAFALAAEQLRLDSCALLAFSTDGHDGPTDAAGAIVTPLLPDQARRKGLNPEAALQRHDSHELLDALSALVRVPPTGTNLNHIAALLIYP
ncbi:MAG TPA: DUF4147 domain-containing protein [Phycisphaerales bacterium]|nr:DUF4147 domain-containing protein [Phycisphaerales bacterium]